MSGRNSFKKLRERVVSDPESRRRVEELGRAYGALLDLAELAELRKSRGVTQAEMAERLGVTQPNVSKIEAAVVAEAGSGKSAALATMQLSTLAHYVEALGGRLEVRALFPDHPENDVALPVAAGGPEEDTKQEARDE